MPISFPNNPSNGQAYSYAGVTYRYNAVRASWDADRMPDSSDVPRTELEAFIDERLQDNVAYRGLFLPEVLQLNVDPSAADDFPTDPLTGSFKTIPGVINWLKQQRLRSGVRVEINLSAGTHVISNVVNINILGFNDVRFIGQSAALNITQASSSAPQSNIPGATTNLRNLMSTTTTVQFISSGRLSFEAGERITVRNIYFTRNATSSPSAAYITADDVNVFEVINCSFYDLKVTGQIRSCITTLGGASRLDLSSCIFADVTRAVELYLCEAFVQDCVMYNCTEAAISAASSKLESVRLYIGAADGITAVNSTLRLTSVELHRSLTFANLYIVSGNARLNGCKVNSGKTGIFGINASINLLNSEVNSNTKRGINVTASQLQMSGGTLQNNTEAGSTAGGGRAVNSSVTLSAVAISGNSTRGWDVIAGSSLSLGNCTGAQATSANIPVNTLNESLGWVTTSI